MKKKLFMFLLMAIAIVVLTGCSGYIKPGVAITPVPDFWDGIWHGLIAPYTLIVRFFKNVYMYALPNSGWSYDLGYLIGVYFSLPIGWLAAILALFY